MNFKMKLKRICHNNFKVLALIKKKYVKNNSKLNLGGGNYNRKNRKPN